MSPILFVMLSLVVGAIYVVVYSFASFLFSYKIYLVGHEKYFLGAVISGMGIFINFSLFAFVPYIAIATTIPWLSIVLLISLGVGSFLSTSVMSKVDLFHTKDKEEDDE